MTQTTATEKLEQERRCAAIGVIVAPGLAHDVTSRIASELDWRTELQVDRLVVPPASCADGRSSRQGISAAKPGTCERSLD